MLTASNKFELCETTLRILEGAVTEEEFRVFEKRLIADAEVRDLYVVLCETYTQFEKMGSTFQSNLMEDFGLSDNALLQALAKVEKTAPVIKIPAEVAVKKESQPETPTVRPYKSSKLSLYAAIVSTAALIFMFIALYFMPVSTNTVGRILETENAVWASSGFVYRGGDILSEGQRLVLKEGFVKIEMDDRSKVLVEAPATFTLEADNQFLLQQGRLTARVPSTALGFTVRTPSASVVDYGTEFGVSVDEQANTEAHVKKGQVELRLGSDTRVFEKAIRLQAQQAGRVEGQTLASIPVSMSQFNYEFPTPFEVEAKAAGASLYLRPAGGGSNPVLALRDNPHLLINARPNPNLAAGPWLGGGQRVDAFRVEPSTPVVKITNVTSLPQSRDGSYSTGFWIRFDRIKEQVICADHVKGKHNNRYCRLILMTEDGRLQHCAYNLRDKFKWRVVTSPDKLRPRSWYFVLISRQVVGSDDKTLYINGRQVDIDLARNAEKRKIEDIWIGEVQSMQYGGAIGDFEGFEGAIAEILFFPRALDDHEVSRLYQLTPKKQDREQ